MIRPAVEAALEVARFGLDARPPEPPPQGLQPYLGFSKLSLPALQAIARVVDSDDAFRAKVAAAVDEEAVGTAGWLWLVRPEGWDERVEVLEREARAEAEAAADQRDERSARRRLAAATEAAERAAATAEAQRLEADRLRGDLAEERSRRAAAEERSVALAADLERLAEERAGAVRQLKETEAKLAVRAAEAKEARGRLRELEASDRSGNVGRPSAAGRPTAVPGSPGEPRVAGEREVGERGADRSSEGGDRAGGRHLGPGHGPSDRDLLADALRAASAGAGALADALERLGELMGRQPDASWPGSPGEVQPAGAPARDEGAGATAGGSAGVSGAPGWGGAGGVPQRVPVKLPGGVLDDSAEAAEHLLRTPNVLVLVDGYNVTMAGWPDLPPAGQRARLLNGLDAVAARSGAELEVVFDGADVEPLRQSQPGPRDVRVRFSPPGVEADDVLLDLVVHIPPARPVVVVSSDNRVRHGARRHGANLLHANQLLAVLRP